MDFNVTHYKKFIDVVSDSTLQTNLKETTTCWEFGLVSKNMLYNHSNVFFFWLGLLG